MSLSVQAIQPVEAVTAIPAAANISQSARLADAPLAVADALVSLGAVPPVPLAYDAAGLIESLLQTSGGSQRAAGSTTAPGLMANVLATATSADIVDVTSIAQSGPTPIAQALATMLAREPNPASTIGEDLLTANQTLTRLLLPDFNAAAASLEMAAALPDSTGVTASTPASEALASSPADAVKTAAPAPSGITSSAAEMATVLPDATSALASKALISASSTPAATTLLGNISGTSEAVSAMASDFLADFVAQELANIASNPAYANAAAALYANKSIFRSRQTPGLDLPEIASGPQPVMPVTVVASVS